MAKLNQHAEKLMSKYIKKVSPENIVDTRKKRGLQAEINKMDAIRRVIINHRIDESELLRFRTELNKLLHTVDSQIGLAK